MSNWEKTDQPCPCGDGNSSYAIDKKGNGYCFKCSKAFMKNKEMTEEQLDEFYTSEYYPHRGLTKGTLQFYQIMTKMLDGEPLETGFLYPNGSVKVRNMHEKKFRTSGPMSQARLFGKDRFDKGSKRSITITEGEYDAASVYQMLGGRTAAVSIRSAASAAKDCEDERDYINSFDKIILAFDSDEPGKEAARAVAGLFDFDKVYRLELSRHKDANAYLQEGDILPFVETWENCKRYTPDQILSSFAEFEQALDSASETLLTEYPVAKLNELLKGIHEQEVIVFKGDEGIGKSEIFRLIEHHLLANTNLTVGIIHLEESVSTTIQGLVSYHKKSPVNMDDGLITKSVIMSDFKDMVGGEEDRVYFHDSYDMDNENAFIDNVRFLVSVCGCKVILFDHISWMATGQDSEDERKKLDRISQRLKVLAKELKFCLIMISHVNDDGKTRGSRNITKVANTVIHLERNKIAPLASERNKLMLTVEKARLRGCQSGPAGYLLWNPATCNLEDIMQNV